MSPRKQLRSESADVEAAVARLWVLFGAQVREARLARRWPLEELATRAGLSRSFVHAIEAGRGGSIEAVTRLSAALSRRPEIELVDPLQRDRRPSLSVDPVHSAMGEFEARQFRSLGFPVGIDEPYQHYQFAGRAGLVAYDLNARALLHIENRTRFPDFQEMAGVFNAKRAYLGASLAERLGITQWRSETHVIAALWSSEVLHTLRLRTESFRALCDPADAFAEWWAGRPLKVGAVKTLVVLDPNATGKQRASVKLDEALSVRPRYRGYADAVRAASAATSR